MDQLVQLLSGLGPWGVVVGAVVVLVLQRLNLKLPSLPSLPSNPAPAPAPTPVPAPATPDRPILNALLKALLAGLAAQAAREGKSVEQVIAEHPAVAEGLQEGK